MRTSCNTIFMGNSSDYECSLKILDFYGLTFKNCYFSVIFDNDGYCIVCIDIV